MGKITAPRLLLPDDLVNDFDCGNNSLNEWLKKRAAKNQNSGASRTFVICIGEKIVGVYAITSGGIDRASAPKSIARNMPESIPVLILGRLGVDKSVQNKQLGSYLLKDALFRTWNVSRNVGVKALVVHAISDQAKLFYLKFGFIESPMSPMTLFLPISQMKQFTD